MLRRIALVAAAAVCLDAGAQTSDASVTTREGGALVWQGECVRAANARGTENDPCPSVGHYVGRTRKDVLGEAKRAHQLKIWNRGDATLETDRVVMQWPRETDFAANGWPSWYPVVLLFDRDPSLPPERPEPPAVPCKEPGGPVTPKPPEDCVNPPVDNRLVPRLLGHSPREAARLAAGMGFEAQRAPLVPQAGDLIAYQSPRAGSMAPAGSTIDYLVVSEAGPPNPPTCPACEICKICPGPIEAQRPGEPPPHLDPLPPRPQPSPLNPIVGVGAGGAGALGGYMLARLLGRRRPGEDDEDAPDAAPAAGAVLRARVHPDRHGVQDVEEL